MRSNNIKIDSDLKLGKIVKTLQKESNNRRVYSMNASMKQILKETLKRINEEEDDIDPEMKKEMEKAFTDGMNQLATGLSSVAKETEAKVDDEAAVEDALDDAPVLKKMVGEALLRRKQMIKEGNDRGRLLTEEIVLFVVSLAIAMPKIIELIGKVTQWIINKLGGKNKAGEKIAHFGHWLHELMLKGIIKGLYIVPGFKQLPKDKQEKIAKIIHTVVVAGLAIASGVGAVKAINDSAYIMGGIEGALTAVKAGELGIISFITTQIKAVLGVVSGAVGAAAGAAAAAA